MDFRDMMRMSTIPGCNLPENWMSPSNESFSISGISFIHAASVYCDPQAVCDAYRAGNFPWWITQLEGESAANAVGDFYRSPTSDLAALCEQQYYPEQPDSGGGGGGGEPSAPQTTTPSVDQFPTQPGGGVNIPGTSIPVADILPLIPIGGGGAVNTQPISPFVPMQPITAPGSGYIPGAGSGAPVAEGFTTTQKVLGVALLLLLLTEDKKKERRR